jgi:hypothetical protein
MIARTSASTPGLIRLHHLPKPHVLSGEGLATVDVQGLAGHCGATHCGPLRAHY